METQNHEAIVCAFANQKGGVGKSTLIHLITKTICDEAIGKKALVLELDHKQKTLSDLKTSFIDNSAETKGKKNGPYDLKIVADLSLVKKLIEENQDKYDIIFLDTPGTMDKSGLIATLTVADLVFIPLNSSIVEVNSTVDFLNTMYKIKEYRNKLGLPFEYYTVLNRVNEKTNFFKFLLKELGEMKINRISATIKDLELYRNYHMENYDPVYSYSPKGKKDASFELFVNEFLVAIDKMKEKLKQTV